MIEIDGRNLDNFYFYLDLNLNATHTADDYFNPYFNQNKTEYT